MATSIEQLFPDNSLKVQPCLMGQQIPRVTLQLVTAFVALVLQCQLACEVVSGAHSLIRRSEAASGLLSRFTPHILF